LMKMMMDKNLAPGWFYMDKQKGLPDAEIMQKIEIELHNEVLNRGYNLKLWTETFVKRVAALYFDHFNKLYEMSSAEKMAFTSA